jgi:hypothetical protein
VYPPAQVGSDALVHTTVDASVSELDVPTVAGGKVALHVLISGTASFYFRFGPASLAPTAAAMVIGGQTSVGVSMRVPTNGEPKIYLGRQTATNPTIYVTPIEDG